MRLFKFCQYTDHVIHKYLTRRIIHRSGLYDGKRRRPDRAERPYHVERLDHVKRLDRVERPDHVKRPVGVTASKNEMKYLILKTLGCSIKYITKYTLGRTKVG